MVKGEARWRRHWLSGSVMYIDTDNSYGHNPAWQTQLFAKSKGLVVTGFNPVGQSPNSCFDWLMLLVPLTMLLTGLTSSLIVRDQPDFDITVWGVPGCLTECL